MASQNCSLASWPHLNSKGRKIAIAALRETCNYHSFEAIGIDYSKAYCWWLRNSGYNSVKMSRSLRPIGACDANCKERSSKKGKNDNKISQR